MTLISPIIASIPPIQALIEEKILTFFRSILTTPGILQDIIIRQHAMKNANSNSWVTYVEKILNKYNLPTVMEILEKAPSKENWKKLVKIQITVKCQEDLEKIAATKSTLKFMSHAASFTEIHHAIKIINNPIKCRRSITKLRLMTGTYSLQTTRAYVYKQISSAQCLLCHSDEETLEHFILHCHVLNEEREFHIKRIISTIPYVYQYRQLILDDEKLLLHLIIDATHPNLSEWLPLSNEEIITLEVLTQSMLYSLHSKRSGIQNMQNFSIC